MSASSPVRKKTSTFLKGCIRFLSLIEFITLSLNFSLGYFLHLYSNRIKAARLYGDAEEAFTVASVISGGIYFIWFLHFLYPLIGFYLLFLPISFLASALGKHALKLELEIYERKQAEMENSNND